MIHKNAQLLQKMMLLVTITKPYKMIRLKHVKKTTNQNVIL